MDDSRIRREIWRGHIPCRIELDPTESRVFDDCDPFYINIPRLSYLPLSIPAIYKFFERFLIDPNESRPENAWFEFESVPLKWHWPTGLLYDLFTGRDPLAAASDDDDEEETLPWTLILHFRNYPQKHLMRLDAPNACHDAWVNALKEADHARNGSAKAVMSLSKDESTRLWDALQLYDFDKYWGIFEKLISTPPNSVRNIPLKVYIPGAARVVQCPVSPFLPTREPQTVGTALRHLLPELFPSQRTVVLARPVVHGVSVAMNTPLLELTQAAVYPDGFLHVSVAMMA